MNNQQEAQIQNPSNLYKKLFFGLLGIVILIVIAGGAYYLGQSQTKKTEIIPTQIPTPIVYPTLEADLEAQAKPSSSVSVKDESIVPVGNNTVSFARVADNTYLRYRGKVYADSNTDEPTEINFPNVGQHTFYGLVDAPSFVPPGKFMFDEVFSFITGPDKKSFALIMRWGDDSITNSSISYYLYFYSPNGKNRQSILVKKFTPDGSFSDNNVPRIDKFSPDTKYLSLSMYSCWNCGGHKPETLLLRLSDNKTKNIGLTSYFTWKDNGAYEYKEYKVIECPPTPTAGEFMPVPCFEKPENLPLKTGQF